MCWTVAQTTLTSAHRFWSEHKFIPQSFLHSSFAALLLLIMIPFLPVLIQGSLSLLLSNCFYGYRDAPCPSLLSTQPPPEVTRAPFVSTNQGFGEGLRLFMCVGNDKVSFSHCCHTLSWSVTPSCGWMIDAFETCMGPICSSVVSLMNGWMLQPISAYIAWHWHCEAPH